MKTDLEKLKTEIEALSPPERLRLAAGLLENKKEDLAYMIADRVVKELGAALMFRKMGRR